MFLKKLLGRDEARHGREFWERHAQYDPLWAILSDPTKKGRKWDLPEFFETGSREISVVLHTLAECGVTINRGAALDFGCGVGRLTQALAEHFESAVGVDISPTMIRLAEKLNRHPTRVRYLSNARDDLRVFDADTFDFIYSDIVLQHVDPASTRRYLPEFVRILRKGGVLAFQLPSHPRPASEQGPFSATPMPEDAYSARIDVYDAPEAASAPADVMTVRGTVTNVSACAWSSDHGPLRVGNHWYDRRGKTMLVQDDGRTALPARLEPGQSFEFELAIKAPIRPGEYRCEIDLVHEAVCWFADRGSSSVTFPVRVGSEATFADNDAAVAAVPAPAIVADDIYAELPGNPKEPGSIPMFCVHRDEVVELLATSGAEIVRVDEDWNGGKDWVGYRYIARK
jgi:SAM-dependent methyltransferase